MTMIIPHLKAVVFCPDFFLKKKTLHLSGGCFEQLLGQVKVASFFFKEQLSIWINNENTHVLLSCYITIIARPETTKITLSHVFLLIDIISDITPILPFDKCGFVMLSQSSTLSPR